MIQMMTALEDFNEPRFYFYFESNHYSCMVVFFQGCVVVTPAVSAVWSSIPLSSTMHTFRAPSTRTSEYNNLALWINGWMDRRKATLLCAAIGQLRKKKLSLRFSHTVALLFSAQIRFRTCLEYRMQHCDYLWKKDGRKVCAFVSTVHCNKQNTLCERTKAEWFWIFLSAL